MERPKPEYDWNSLSLPAWANIHISHMGNYIKWLESELYAYKGERILLKQEIESLRHNDPYLDR